MAAIERKRRLEILPETPPETLKELLESNICHRCHHPVPPGESARLILMVAAGILHHHGHIGEKDLQEINHAQTTMIENGFDIHYLPSEECPGYKPPLPSGGKVIVPGSRGMPSNKFSLTLEQAEQIVRGWFPYQ